MVEESKVQKTPFHLAPFNGGKQQPTAGTDLERLCQLATQSGAAAEQGYAGLGSEMRARCISSTNLTPAVKPNPQPSTEGTPGAMADWEWHGQKR